MWSWLRRIFTGKDQPAAGAKPDAKGSGEARPAFVGPASTPSSGDRRDASNVAEGGEVSTPLKASTSSGVQSSKVEEPFKADATPELVTEVPPWGVPLGSPERINFFTSLVFRYFNLRKIPMRMEQGVVETLEHDARDQAPGSHAEPHVVSPEAQSADATKSSQPSRMRYGLWNIMQTCAGADRSEWAGLIAAHFDTVRRAPDVELRYSDRLASFESCKAHLCVRVFDEAHLPEPLEGEAFIRRPAPGLMSVIVVDFPESCRSLRRIEAQPWNVEESLLWSAAERNIAPLARAEVQRLGPDDEPGLMVLTGDSIYVASMIHRLDDTPEMTGALGTLVSVPVRHAVLTLPIDDASSIRALAPMIGMTVQLERAGPGSVSGRVFFRAAKPPEDQTNEPGRTAESSRWSELKYALEGRSVEIIEAPEALSALLEELGTRQASEQPEYDETGHDAADTPGGTDPDEDDDDDRHDDTNRGRDPNDPPSSPPPSTPPTRPAP